MSSGSSGQFSSKWSDDWGSQQGAPCEGGVSRAAVSHMGFGGLQSGSDALLPETHCPGLVSGPVACTGQDSVGSVRMLSEWPVSQAGWLPKDGRNQCSRLKEAPMKGNLLTEARLES